jgi:inosine-uridine nucleoside N-ribohydrolase
MARKVIIDCDPGIDDAVALAMALFDPRLEVVAVTAVAGNVSADLASRNVQALIEQLDPPKFPRMGMATPSETASGSDARHIHGEDGLGNANFACSTLVRQHPSEKVLADEIRAAPNEITVLCLGPLTNVARMFQRDPALMEMVGQVVIGGGAVNCIGNATPTAEFNIYCDPECARTVFKAPITKTLVPLDITSRVAFDFGFLSKLPAESSKVGNVLHRILPFFGRVYRQQLGMEQFYLHAPVALVALTNPELFETMEMEGDIEVSGELTIGTTVFDRRITFRGQRNMDVLREIDVPAVTDCILRSLSEAEKASS